MKNLFFLVSAVLLTGHQVLQAQPSIQNIIKNPANSVSKTSKLNAIINTYVNKGLPGMIVLVKNGDLTWQTAAGFSNVEKGIAMETTNELMIASITKMFVAVVTLRLQEEGKLDIDKPINTFKCGYRFKDIPNAEKITTRHLLNHTSGLPDFIITSRFVTNMLDRPLNNWKKEDLLKFLANTKSEFIPGEKGKYSNSNFLLLSVILDEEFKDSIDHASLIQRNIIDPLMLDHTQYINRKDPPTNLAQGYADLYSNNHLINLTHLNIGGSGNGFSGMFSTVGDLSKFLDALLVKKTLLKDSSLKQMLSFTQDSEEEAVAFGLGIWKDFQDTGADKFAYGHRGREAAYTADLFWFPTQDIMYVMMMNCGIGTVSPFKDMFLEFRKEFVTELLNGSESNVQK
jgi:D-alanyl-D-alanine carboxypeptidase